MTIQQANHRHIHGRDRGIPKTLYPLVCCWAGKIFMKVKL